MNIDVSNHLAPIIGYHGIKSKIQQLHNRLTITVFGAQEPAHYLQPFFDTCADRSRRSDGSGLLRPVWLWVRSREPRTNDRNGGTLSDVSG